MSESPFSLDYDEAEESVNIWELTKKYLRYWPWFVMWVLVCLGLAYAYMRYAPIVYESVAKIKIIDEAKEMDITPDPVAMLSGNAGINLGNEIQVLKSYRILRQVVEALHLDVSYFHKGNIKTTEIWNPPFAITKLIAEDSIGKTRIYDITMDAFKAQITDGNGEMTTIGFTEQDTLPTGLPFNITFLESAQPMEYEGIEFRIVLKSIKDAVFDLSNKLQVNPTDKKSEVLSLSIKGQSPDRSETVINELINKFNQDGIIDRQLISKRTLEFIDERFVYLSGELDSIEVGKESFKRANALTYIESDADFSLQRKAITQDEVTNLETQISLASLLKNAVVGQSAYGLLPVDVGLENSGINSLVAEYNEMAIQREKLVATVGENHPTLVTLSGQLENLKVNILRSLNVYQTQLKLSLRQLNREKSQANSMFSQLPEKEKTLRAIERQQSIKENLFLLLLQRREEAAMNYATTAPSIKVVDYALTSTEPLSPKKRIVYPIGLLMGLLLPFGLLYLKFSMNGKIVERSDIENSPSEISVLGEIPHLRKIKKFHNAHDRSILAESFRILATNVNYFLPKSDKGQGRVIYVTSSIEGEGKSLLAYNLSVAFASLNKKVLLLDADLRSPTLHDYFGMGKSTKGLADYLKDPRIHWNEFVYPGLENNRYHKVCLSGPVPPNAPQLLSNEGFETFITSAKEAYDYMVVDTAPTMLVADTLLISKYADITLYVMRAGFTDKKLLNFSKDLHNKRKLANMAFVLNDVSPKDSKQYGYGYGQKS
ncbi:tyrosine-protein kinase family protein [Ulvibacterium sp.]|uniref:GumC family protein n=1 Tax=Ulvibacterium sp. TaxID=2665914 RepID=UPI00260C0043|nr:tyrosine-protein kinase family protein [Ulvibacterium sp.]